MTCTRSHSKLAVRLRGNPSFFLHPEAGSHLQPFSSLCTCVFLGPKGGLSSEKCPFPGRAHSSWLRAKDRALCVLRQLAREQNVVFGRASVEPGGQAKSLEPHSCCHWAGTAHPRGCGRAPFPFLEVTAQETEVSL